MHVLDDPGLSSRLRDFLSQRARRFGAMPEKAIRASARVVTGPERTAPAPAEVVDALVAFEERYGGLAYPMLCLDMEYGLGGEAVSYRTEYGWAFAGILEGDRTWGIDVLVDGRTTLTVGHGGRRLIDRSIEQRLEKHALLTSVQSWPHRTLTLTVESGVVPDMSPERLPAPAAPEATGPADLWWCSDRIAVHLELATWWHASDTWTLRCFSRHADDLPGVLASVTSAVSGQDLEDAARCVLCNRLVGREDVCIPQATGSGPL